MTTTAKGVTPEMVEAPHPLAIYADSYAQMGRMGDGKVDCRSVEVDIRQNMIPVTQAVSSGGLAVKALRKANEAIAEYVRYLDGGEMRGSYDGKPEREALRKAGYATLSALLALDRTTLPAAEGMVLDQDERMLLGWMLAAFEQSKVGQKITDDLKREMRAANRLVGRLSSSNGAL